jgi:hypothetical protein
MIHSEARLTESLSDVQRPKTTNNNDTRFCVSNLFLETKFQLLEFDKSVDFAKSILNFAKSRGSFRVYRTWIYVRYRIAVCFHQHHHHVLTSFFSRMQQQTKSKTRLYLLECSALYSLCIKEAHATGRNFSE